MALANSSTISKITKIADHMEFGASICCAVIVLYCSIVILGYLTGSLNLLALPGEPPTRSSTAISILLLATALFVQQSRPSAQHFRICQALAAVALIGSVATALETMCGVDWGLNHIWWQANNDAPGLTYPGPMTATLSLVLAVQAVAIILPSRFSDGNNKLNTPLIMHGCVLLFSSLLLLSLSCGVGYICAIGSCIKITPAVSILTGLISMAALLGRPDLKPISLLCVDTIAGAMGRYLTGIILLLPALLWLRNTLVTVGLVNDPMGWCVFAVQMLGLCVAALVKLNGKIALEAEETRLEFEKQLAQVGAFSQTSAAAIVEKFQLICLLCGNQYNDELDLVRCPADDNELSKVLDDDIIGKTLAGKYRIVEYIGDGAMSIVYKGRHELLDTDCAIKVLRPHLQSNKDSLMRFHQEARAAKKVSHQNVLSVQDFGITPEGKAYIVMDLLKGLSLRDYIAEHGALDAEDALPLFLQVCDGLMSAHESGVIHRDMKPSNIMLITQSKQTIAKIVDFGLAKLTEMDMKLTETGYVVGSPLYMSPEQCMDTPLDHRSDIYSWGCVMYEVLSGLPPFVSDNILEVYQLHTAQHPKPFGDELEVPIALENAIFKCLEKNPANRFRNVNELRVCLKKILWASVKVRSSIATEAHQSATL